MSRTGAGSLFKAVVVAVGLFGTAAQDCSTGDAACPAPPGPAGDQTSLLQAGGVAAAGIAAGDFDGWPRKGKKVWNAIASEVFDDLDQNQDGAITKEEFVMGSNEIECSSDENCQKVSSGKTPFCVRHKGYPSVYNPNSGFCSYTPVAPPNCKTWNMTCPRNDKVCEEILKMPCCREEGKSGKCMKGIRKNNKGDHDNLPNKHACRRDGDCNDSTDKCRRYECFQCSDKDCETTADCCGKMKCSKYNKCT